MSLASGTARHGPHSAERARFTTSSVRSPIIVVTAHGEIDAANALALGRYVEAEMESTSRLILDLRGLSFFGTQGFSILHRINVMCSRFAVNWVFISGSEVQRVLRICDPDGGLPVTDTVEDAVAAVSSPPRNHLRLVPGG